MAEYIERETVCNLLLGFRKPYGVGDVMWINITEDIVTELDKIPAADVRPERHGHWVKESKMMGAFQRNLCICSICGFWYDEDSGGETFKYCLNCGAKMDGKDNK